VNAEIGWEREMGWGVRWVGWEMDWGGDRLEQGYGLGETEGLGGTWV